MIYLILIWLICGILGYSMALYTFTEKFPYFNNMYIAKFCFITGVAGLISILIVINISKDIKFGFQLFPYSKEKRWKIFQNNFGKDYYSEAQFYVEYP